MTASPTSETGTLTESNLPEIEGITESTLLQYFETINRSDFQATSELFAVDGALKPPFEEPIVGSEAIAAYLQAEAKEFILQPRQGVTQPTGDGNTEAQISGKVQTPLFSVNVSWHFILNPAQEILFVRVKLLASPQELLKLRR